MSQKRSEKKKGTTERKRSSRDKRDDQRIPIQMLVDYKSDGNYLFDFCRDLGTGGVFIQTRNPLESGSDVDLTFTLPDSKETLQTKGKVIWVQSDVPGKDLIPGMGVQFTAFSKEDRDLLEEFVTRYHEIHQGDLDDPNDQSA